MTSALATPGVSAASAASAAEVGSAQPLPFRQDDAPAFPLGGAVLLFGLMAAALYIVWWDRRRGGSKHRWPQLLKGRSSTDAGTQDVQVMSSTRIDATTRVHVLAWQGRQLLVAVQAGQPPVVLDRQDGSAGDSAATGASS